MLKAVGMGRSQSTDCPHIAMHSCLAACSNHVKWPSRTRRHTYVQGSSRSRLCQDIMIARSELKPSNLEAFVLRFKPADASKSIYDHKKVWEQALLQASIYVCMIRNRPALQMPRVMQLLCGTLQQKPGDFEQNWLKLCKAKSQMTATCLGK